MFLCRTRVTKYRYGCNGKSLSPIDMGFERAVLQSG